MAMSDKRSRENRSRSNGVSRRTFVRAAGASGVAAGLAGCADVLSGGGGGGGGNTVKWSMGATGGIGENWDQITQLMHDGGLSDDIEVELVTAAQETGQQRNNYTRLLNAGERDPDIMAMDNGWLNNFIARDLVANMSEMEGLGDTISKLNNEYFQGFLSTAQDAEDNIYGVPLFPDFPTMQYRKDLVEEAGYDTSDWATNTMSWKEFSEITADVKEQTGTKFGFTTQWDIYVGTACCDFNEVLTSWGGAYFGGRDTLHGPVGDRPVTVDEEPVVNGLKMMRSFVHGPGGENALDGYQKIAPQAILSWTEEPSRKPMANGNAIMHRNWPYAFPLNTGEDAIPQEDYGAMPIPSGVPEGEGNYEGTGGTASALGGWHATVNPNTQNMDAVKEVLKAITSREFNIGMFKLQGWIPPKPSLFNSDVATDPEQVGIIANYIDTLRVAGENTIARPSSPVWSDQVSIIAQEANNAVAREKTPQKAMADLKSSLTQIENNFSG